LEGWCDYGGVFLIRDTKPLKVTFTRAQFFPGLEGKYEIIGMILTHICRTAPESLVTNGVLFTVLTFHLFHHGNFLCSLFIDTFPGIWAIKSHYSRRIYDRDNLPGDIRYFKGSPCVFFFNPIVH
jgi:hypothetical protein